MNPDGSGQARLLPELARDPAWSSDGTKIAFTTHDREVAVVNADGSGLTMLTSSGPTVTSELPSWSPDGSSIAFTRFVPDAGSFGAFEIHTMNADGSHQQRLTDSRADGLGLHAVEPAWSPDGSRIAFTRTIAANSDVDQEIYVINSDGSGLVNLSTNPSPGSTGSNDGEPTWSPDGTKIAFRSFRDGKHGIYTMRPDGSAVTKITSDTGPGRDPAWSPDGTRIAYVSQRPTFPTSGYQVFVANSDGTGEVQLTSSGPTHSFNPDWQPVPTRPPDCSTLTAVPPSLRPANHKFRRVEITGATDPDGDAISIAIDGVTQDEPVGRHPDARAGAAPNLIGLRAERQPRGDGRVYRISVTVTDTGGDSCTGVVTVEVRRKAEQPAVDSAPPSYNSLE